MGIHSLSEINEGERTAICSECGPVPIRKGSPGKHAKWRCKPGEQRYPKKTKSESAEMKRRKKRRSFKRDRCERCGFIPEHPTQLDIHHKDEDKDNEDRPDRLHGRRRTEIMIISGVRPSKFFAAGGEHGYS